MPRCVPQLIPTAKPVAAALSERRRGYLEPEEFSAIMIEMFGRWGWKSRLAAGTGWATSTVSRYACTDHRHMPIPKDVALLVELLQTLRGHDIPLPDVFSTDHRT